LGNDTKIYNKFPRVNLNIYKYVNIPWRTPNLCIWYTNKEGELFFSIPNVSMQFPKRFPKSTVTLWYRNQTNIIVQLIKIIIMYSFYKFSFFFLAVLGFELRTLHMLVRCSTAKATPSTLLCILHMMGFKWNFTFVISLPQAHNPNLVMREISDKFCLRNYLQNVFPSPEDQKSCSPSYVDFRSRANTTRG
jgi:hypothetical protein